MKAFFGIAVLLILLAAAVPVVGAADKNYDAAVKLIRSRNYDAAKILLKLSLKENPTSIKVLKALAFIAEKKKNKREALDYYRKIVLIQKAKGGSSKTADKARQTIVRLSPASGLILQKYEEIIAKAQATKNEDEKALLQLSAKILQALALGEVEITIAKKPKKEEKAVPVSPLKQKRKPRGRYTSLTTLEPLFAEVGAHGYKVNQYRDGRKPIINEKACGEFLYTHAASEVAFRIPATARFFTATGCSLASKEGIVFVVKLDDEEIYRSKRLEEYPLRVVDIEVPLKHTREKTKILKLVVEEESGDINMKHSAWCFPRIYKR